MDLSIAGESALLLAVLAAGFASGFVGGLFGIGGGVVTVPALYAAYAAVGVAPAPALKSAIGTSLAVIIVTSIRSLATHHQTGHVDLRIIRAWGPWIALGSAVGGLASRYVSGEALTIIFAAGAAFIGWRRLRRKPPGSRRPAPDLTDRRIHIPVGIGAGVFSSLMGLGGGAIAVMVMTWAGRHIHQAIATASGFGIAVAVPGAVGFVLAGLNHHDLPPYSLGYVNGPAFLAMAIASAIAAPIGARLAHRTKGELLSKLFAGYILAAAAGLLWDVFGRA